MFEIFVSIDYKLTWVHNSSIALLLRVSVPCIQSCMGDFPLSLLIGGHLRKFPNSDWYEVHMYRCSANRYLLDQVFHIVPCHKTNNKIHGYNQRTYHAKGVQSFGCAHFFLQCGSLYQDLERDGSAYTLQHLPSLHLCPIALLMADQITVCAFLLVEYFKKRIILQYPSMPPWIAKHHLQVI
jgi:hypothetical protein